MRIRRGLGRAAPKTALEPLTEADQRFVSLQVERVHTALAERGQASVTATALESLWSQLHDEEPDDEGLTPLIAFSFGQLLVDELDFQWVVLREAGRTDFAVQRSILVVFPVGLLRQGERGHGVETLTTQYESIVRMTAALPADDGPAVEILLGREEEIEGITVTEARVDKEERVEPLNEAEEEWVATHVAAAREAIAELGIDPSGDITPEALDRVWSWLLQADLDDPNHAINLVGLAFGQLFVDEGKCSWVALTDEDGTDIAVRGVSDWTIFPTNFIAKRYERRETGFIALAYREMRAHLEELRLG